MCNYVEGVGRSLGPPLCDLHRFSERDSLKGDGVRRISTQLTDVLTARPRRRGARGHQGQGNIVPGTLRPCFPPKICYQGFGGTDSPNRPFSFGRGHQGPRPTFSLREPSTCLVYL